MDLSLGLLVKTGAGLFGKTVVSLKSLYMIFHLFVSISCIEGRHLVNSTDSVVGLSLSNRFILGFNMFSWLVWFIFKILFNVYLLYPLRARCFSNFYCILDIRLPTWCYGYTSRMQCTTHSKYSIKSGRRCVTTQH